MLFEAALALFNEGEQARPKDADATVRDRSDDAGELLQNAVANL